MPEETNNNNQPAENTAEQQTSQANAPQTAPEVEKPAEATASTVEPVAPQAEPVKSAETPTTQPSANPFGTPAQPAVSTQPVQPTTPQAPAFGVPQPQPAYGQPMPQPVYGQPQSTQPVMANGEPVGLGGWLMYFMVMFYISGGLGILSFLGSLSSSDNGGVSLSSLAISGVALAAAICINMKKKAGKVLAIISYSLSIVFSVIMFIAGLVFAFGAAATSDSYTTTYSYGEGYSYSYSSGISGFLAAFSGIMIVLGIIYLGVSIASIIYFVKSRRVKNTLIG